VLQDAEGNFYQGGHAYDPDHIMPLVGEKGQFARGRLGSGPGLHGCG
jgi:hypothetical protein